MRRILEQLASLWALLGGLILLSIVLVTSANVGAFALDRIARLSGGTVTALPGYEDFVRLAISAAALMIFPYCQLRRGHVAVDLFVSALPPPVQRVLDAVSQAGIVALAAFLAYWMTLGLLETRADGALSRVLGWPEWPFYAPGVLSLLLWALVAASQLFAGEADG
jgi:TRAP-type C4-dicarboxylate transport system permease small subunit